MPTGFNDALDWESALARLQQGRTSSPDADRLYAAPDVLPRHGSAYGPAQGDLTPVEGLADPVGWLAALVAPYLQGGATAALNGLATRPVARGAIDRLPADLAMTLRRTGPPVPMTSAQGIPSAFPGGAGPDTMTALEQATISRPGYGAGPSIPWADMGAPPRYGSLPPESPPGTAPWYVGADPMPRNPMTDPPSLRLHDLSVTERLPSVPLTRMPHPGSEEAQALIQEFMPRPLVAALKQGYTLAPADQLRLAHQSRMLGNWYHNHPWSSAHPEGPQMPGTMRLIKDGLDAATARAQVWLTQQGTP